METSQLPRILAALAAILASVMLVITNDIAIPVALSLFITGILITALIAPLFNKATELQKSASNNDYSPAYGIADVMAAIDEPLLIVQNRRVLRANKAAKLALGEHIEGGDVRLAIRHPAAAERLTGQTDEDAGNNSDGDSNIELVGLGERERRWNMTAIRLQDGSRLVRLTDRSEAFASEKMRGDFVANASHELRTPLASLIGFLETMQDEKNVKDKKTRERFYAIMSGEAHRMQRLIDDLISLSRIEAERFTPPRESVDLLPLVEEVRLNCAQMIEDEQSKIIVESTGTLPAVSGDRLQLLQLLQNLVVNALKYGRRGAPVVIQFEKTSGEMLRISIIDQGEGIAPEHLPRLTERFYRVDPGRSRMIGGTGLGLAIVKHIVGRHQGQLDIRSVVGKGTSVSVTLPCISEPAVTKT